jgi:hypothetical protein
VPPRHAYWTIIIDDHPTSFRAHDVEELLPTFNRLREKNPTAQLKWFERGQLWDTRDAARAQGFGQGERRWEGPRPDRDARARSGGASAPPNRDERPRDRSWRPGGEHRDPRQKYKDAKKAKWQEFKKNLHTRWEDKQRRELPPPEPDRGHHTPPHGDPMRPKARPERREEAGRGVARRNLGAPAAMRQDWRPDDRRRENGPRGERRDFRREDDRRGPWRPREDDRRGGWTPKGKPPTGPRKPWGTKPGGARKPWGSKPGGPPRPSGARKPWGTKPSGGRRKPYRSGPLRPPRPESKGPRGPRKRRDDEE